MQVLTELDTHTEHHHPHTCGGPGSPALHTPDSVCSSCVAANTTTWHSPKARPSKNELEVINKRPDFGRSMFFLCYSFTTSHFLIQFLFWARTCLSLSIFHISGFHQHLSVLLFLLSQRHWRQFQYFHRKMVTRTLTRANQVFYEQEKKNS